MTKTIRTCDGKNRVWIEADNKNWVGKAQLYEIVKYTLKEYLDEQSRGDLFSEEEAEHINLAELEAHFEALKAFAAGPVGVAYTVISSCEFSESELFYSTHAEARDVALNQFC